MIQNSKSQFSQKKSPLRLFFFLAVQFAILATAVYGFLNPSFEGFGVWRMYENLGKGICKVQFFQDEKLQRTPIDRYDSLGFQSRWYAPKEYRFVHRNDKLDAVSQVLCGSLVGDNQNITYVVECPLKGEWREFLRREQVCGN